LKMKKRTQTDLAPRQPVEGLPAAEAYMGKHRKENGYDSER